MNSRLDCLYLHRAVCNQQPHGCRLTSPLAHYLYYSACLMIINLFIACGPRNSSKQPKIPPLALFDRKNPNNTRYYYFYGPEYGNSPFSPSHLRPRVNYLFNYTNDLSSLLFLLPRYLFLCGTQANDCPPVKNVAH